MVYSHAHLLSFLLLILLVVSYEEVEDQVGEVETDDLLELALSDVGPNYHNVIEQAVRYMPIFQHWRHAKILDDEVS